MTDVAVGCGQGLLPVSAPPSCCRQVWKKVRSASTRRELLCSQCRAASEEEAVAFGQREEQFGDGDLEGV